MTKRLSTPLGIGFFSLLAAALTPIVSHASCLEKEVLTQITFAHNSSYFSAADRQKLSQIIAPPSEQGYLLLEFSLQTNPQDQVKTDYDIWLAKRRIQRVKDYLSQQ